MNEYSSFLHELKRRQVFGTVVVYAVAAWAVIEVGDMAIGAGMLTGITTHNLFTLALVGFPLVLIAGWFYDVTRNGIFRTAPAIADDSFDASLRGKDYGAFLVLLGIWAGSYAYLHTPPAVEKSLAIMPFENRGNDPENAHFAFGIQDDLMTQLQRIRDLKLIARASSEKIDPDTPVEQAGLRLGAAFIMKGTVERVLDRVRVNVVLIEAAEARQAWSGSFDRELTALNLFDIRDEITKSITGELQAFLSPEERAVVFDLPTTSMEAQLHYTRGRQLMATRHSDRLREAVTEFESAVEIDPEFALAWVGVADATALLWIATGLDGDAAAAAHTEAVGKALELNDRLGEAWATYGDNLKGQGKYEEAGAAYRKGIELAPNYARAYHQYAFGLIRPDQVKQRLGLYLRATQLDPLSTLYKGQLSGTLNLLGRDDEALQQAMELVEGGSGQNNSSPLVAELLATDGRFAEAIQWIRGAVEADPNNQLWLVNLASYYMAIGDFEATAQVREWMRERLGPDNRAGHMIEFYLLFRQERYDEFLAYLDGLPARLKASPTDSLLRGYAAIIRGDFEAARDYWLAWRPAWSRPGEWERTAAEGHNDGVECIGAGLLIATGDERLGRQLLEDYLHWYEQELPNYVEHLDRWREPGICYLVRGEYDRALEFFRRRIDHGHYEDWWQTSRLPWWKPLRDDSRFIALGEKVDDLIAEQRKLLREMK